MAGLNKVQLIGRLGNDPEARVLSNGNAVANISIATSETWKDKTTGEKQERTEWHRIVFYGRVAEIARDYLKKGSQCYVEGKLQTRKWQDKNTGQDHYTTEIIADQLMLLDSKQSGEGGQRQPQSSAPAPAQNSRPPAQQSKTFDDFEDDIPF